ncbi:MAG TPA: hypothetical protein VF997_14835 [Polyangia bacterium]
MRAALLLALVAVAVAVGGCGGGSDVASAEMALSASGLLPSDVAAVEILVFDGANAGCARVLTGATPLDDAGLVLVAHALFTIDGTPKHLAIPAGKPLDFYAEAFRTPAPNRVRIGRGCASQTLAAGAAATVSISITATE